MSRLGRAWTETPARQRVESALAWALLAFQIAVPWTIPHYITQDGPSHLYTATVAKDLILHPQGLYASVYRFQPRLVSNWSTTILLGALAPVFGTARAEAAIASACILAGFTALAYFRRSLDPAVSPFDTVNNFLLNTWFLWIGYYNFYLGMVLCLCLTGYYIRRGRALALGVGLVVLFFTHALAAALALMAIAVTFFAESVTGERRAMRPILAAVTPVVVLLGFFMRGYSARTEFRPDSVAALKSFPMHVFASARGRITEEALLVLAMMLLLFAGLLVLRQKEWNAVRLGMAGAAAISFAGYLLAPDTGFGGDQIKIRLAWAVFLFGLPVAFSAARMRVLRVPIGIFIAGLVAASLIATARLERNAGRAGQAYEAALEKIPEGSAIVRMHYQLQAAREKYGFDRLAGDPLFHADALFAAQKRLIDLTDYQAPNRTFPITFRKEFSGQEQGRLWRLEIGETSGLEVLKQAIDGLPVRADYIVLVGDPASVAPAAAWLDANWSLLSAPGVVHPLRVVRASSSGDSFVHVYRR